MTRGLLDEIRKRQMEFIRHVLRKKEMECLLLTVQHLEISCTELIHAAKDHAKWMTMATSICIKHDTQ